MHSFIIAMHSDERKVDINILQWSCKAHGRPAAAVRGVPRLGVTTFGHGLALRTHTQKQGSV